MYESYMNGSFLRRMKTFREQFVRKQISEPEPVLWFFEDTASLNEGGLQGGFSEYTMPYFSGFFERTIVLR